MILNKKRYIGKIHLRHKIITLMVLSVCFPMSIAGIYFFSSISTILTKNTDDSLDQLIGQVNDNIESSFNIIDNTLMQFLSNKVIMAWISDNTTQNDEYNLFVKKNEIEENLKYSLTFNNAWDSKLITTAYLFLNESSFCSISRSLKNIQTVNDDNCMIYNKLGKKPSEGKTIIPPSEEDRTIYFIRDLKNLNNPEQFLRLIMGTDESVILQKYQSLFNSMRSRLFIVDNEGMIYSSSDKELLGKNIASINLNIKDYEDIQTVTIENQSYFVASERIDSTNLTSIVLILKKDAMKNLTFSMRNYMLITLIIIFAFLILSIVVSILFTRFIKDFVYNLNLVKSGNYDSKMSEYSDSDLNLLSETFNKMTSEIKNLIYQVYEKQLLLKESEYKFLQSQMNPHFLFNVLLTISWKARMLKDETIYKMVTSLSELLRAGISSDSKPKVTILQELDYVHFYLYLQKIRFEDRLEYNITVVDDSILKYYIPRLCIEPIVENAVVHGLENKVSKGNITVKVYKNESYICFEITDDGNGFTPGTLDFTTFESREAEKGTHQSIGLKNTNKRIKLIYGEQYGIEIESAINEGSKIIVKIPFDTEAH